MVEAAVVLLPPLLLVLPRYGSSPAAVAWSVAVGGGGGSGMVLGSSPIVDEIAPFVWLKQFFICEVLFVFGLSFLRSTMLLIVWTTDDHKNTKLLQKYAEVYGLPRKGRDVRC